MSIETIALLIIVVALMLALRPSPTDKIYQCKCKGVWLYAGGGGGQDITKRFHCEKCGPKTKAMLEKYGFKSK